MIKDEGVVGLMRLGFEYINDNLSFYESIFRKKFEQEILDKEKIENLKD